MVWAVSPFYWTGWIHNWGEGERGTDGVNFSMTRLSIILQYKIRQISSL